jgi:hypothetical protein
VAAHLEALGYRVERQRFSFAPSAPLGLPVFGAGLGALGLLLLPALTGTALPGWTAGLLLAGGLALLVLLAVGVGLGWMPLGGPPREDANLIATRGPGPVRRWIVAHLDTKAQAQSMAGRLIAVWIVLLAVVMLATTRDRAVLGAAPAPAGCGGSGAGGRRGRPGWRRPAPRGLPWRARQREWRGRRAGRGGVPGRRRDWNPDHRRRGVWPGGRAGVRGRTGRSAARAVIVNLDTIDQEGELALVSHDGRGTAFARTIAPALAGAGLPARIRRLPLGILTDSVPFARRGLAAVTIGRLTWRTLRLIHTPRDTADGLSLETAERVGRALAAN